MFWLKIVWNVIKYVAQNMFIQFSKDKISNEITFKTLSRRFKNSLTCLFLFSSANIYAIKSEFSVSEKPRNLQDI